MIGPDLLESHSVEADLPMKRVFTLIKETMLASTRLVVFVIVRRG